MDKIVNSAFDETLTYVLGGNSSSIANPTNHDFEIRNSLSGNIIGSLHFQEGPIGADGVTGVLNEDLLVILINRIESFQKSKLACRENENALARLYEALWWLNKRNCKGSNSQKEK